ncbi:MAG: sulfatase-like hydrolase/transferase [Verrucomicrobiales bacterium]|nr:sulfatase-like hydrolase/transferase [Verrucomicrobiales bacterium]
MPLRTVLAALVACSLLASLASAAASRPLNVVLIVADDLGAHDLGVTGSRFHETPHLDRLAAQGMRFTQAYSACTVCSPSRAALLTGLYPARLKLTDWIKGHAAPQAKLQPPTWTQQLNLDHVTLAERLTAGTASERTSLHLGKWHLGGDGFEPEKQGFGLNLGGDHRGQPPSYFAPYGLPRLPDGPAGEYLTDREGDEAVRFITAHRDRPFLLNYWPYSVHTPLQAKPELVAKYRAKAQLVGGSQTNATYAAMLESLDTTVGRILRALDEQGLADHTLVIFTSDNGGLVLGSAPPTSNAPLRAGKGSPYEGGHRVPLLVKWPGVTPPGSTSAQPVMGIDLHPTLAEATGLAPEAVAKLNLDGVSLVPLLRQPTASLPREALLWHYPHYHPGGATPYAALRSGDWKLIQFYESGRHELYRLSTDPGETQDLAGTETNQVMVLARQLAALQNKVQAQWPMPNPGWNPVPIPTPAQGPIALHSRQAFVHGELLRYEPQPFKDTLGWWAKEGDWAEWILDVASPGHYSLEILHGCGNGSGGSEVAFSIGTSKVTFTVQETGGFQNFVWRNLGRLELPTGRQSLQVRPLKKPGGAVMDIRELRLIPAPGP